MTDTTSKTNRELRRFGLVMAAGLGLIGVVLLWRHRPAWPALLGAAALLLVAGLVVPRALAPVERAWLAIAGWISVAMTYVILTLTFYLVVTPLGVIMRLLGRDPLGLKLEPEQESYWLPVEPDGPASRPDKPF